MTTPTWQSPTSGQLPKADHVNQFLVTHPMNVIYQSPGQGSAQTTAGSGSVNSNGTYLAQSFTTSSIQTAITYVVLYTATSAGLSGLLPPTTVSLHADNAGAPAATALQSVTVTGEYVYNLPLVNTYLPLPVSVSPSTKYWLVMSAAGDVTNYFTWYKSNQTSGASTSPDGSTWTAQAYGFRYEVWRQGVAGSNEWFTWEDNGDRWMFFSYNTNGTVAALAEYTVGQTATTYTQTYQNFFYTSGQFVGT